MLVQNLVCKRSKYYIPHLGSTPAKPELTFNDDTLTIKWDKVTGKPDYYVEYKAKNDESWTRSKQLDTTIVQYFIYNIDLGRVYNVRILAEHEFNLVYGEVAELFVPTIKRKYLYVVSFLCFR